LGLADALLRCYLTGVKRLVMMLMMIALAVTNATAMAAAVCRHQSAEAHVAALNSSDESIAAPARLEQAADDHMAKRGALADGGASSLPAFILPAEPVAPALPHPKATPLWPRNPAMRPGVAVQPLLQPPSA
jgi:predicted lipid-binding transport protein (Tim44 family)